MDINRHLTSLQNPVIKNIALLGAKPRERKDQQLFVAEGLREVELALSSGFEMETLLFDEKITPVTIIENLLQKSVAASTEIIAVTTPVFEKIAYRSGVPNVVGVFKQKNFNLENIHLQKDPLLLVLENLEKPGNLGAILRTADAAGVDAVLVCDPQTEVFNPNVIRASLGAVFTVPVVVLSSSEAVAWLKNSGIRIFATWLEAAQPVYTCNLNQALAFVLGSEATGISGFWVAQSDERIIIPMHGQVDSLNVSASAAIVLFEAVRQRSG